jgi:hypothetical protein
MTIDDFLEKFEPLVTDWDKWFDLHVDRSSGDITNDAFLEEIKKLGVPAEDVDAYFALLLEMDAQISDIMNGFNTDAMDVIFKYDGFSELQDSFKAHLKSGEQEKAEDLLRSNLEMEDGEVEALIGHFQWIIRTEEMEQEYSEEEDDTTDTNA